MHGLDVIHDRNARATLREHREALDAHEVSLANQIALANRDLFFRRGADLVERS